MRTFTLGSGANVVKYSNAGETAKITEAKAKDAIAAAVASAASSADTIYNVKVGDRIDIKAVAGDSAVLVSSGNVIKSDGIGLVTLTTGVDVLLIKDNADYFLVYENSGTSGSADSLGANAEVIKLVGLTDSSKITIDNGIVTIA